MTNTHKNKLKIIMKNIKFEYIVLFVIILIAVFLRVDNVGDFSSKEEGEIAYISSLIADGKLNPLYIELTEEDGFLDKRFIIAPFAYIPFVFSISLFGKTFLSIKMIPFLFSIFVIIFFYLLLSKYYGRLIALFSAFLFAVTPYSIHFGRVGLLNSMMFFIFILALLYFKKAQDENNVKNYYFISLFVLISQFIYEFYVLISMLSFIPLIALYYFRTNISRRTFFNHIYHILLSFTISFLIYLLYLFFPVFLFGNYGYLFAFLDSLFNNIIYHFSVYSPSYYHNLFTIFKELFFTPMLLLLLIPSILGFLICLYKFKEKLNSVFVSLVFLVPIYALFSRDIFGVISVTIFSFVIFSSISIIYSYERYSKKDILKVPVEKSGTRPSFFKVLFRDMLFSSMAFIWFAYLLFLLRFYFVIFEEQWRHFYSVLESLNISFLYNIFTEYFNLIIGLLFATFLTLYIFSTNDVNYKLRKSFSQKAIFVFILIALVLSISFVSFGFSKDNSVKGTLEIKNYIEKDSESDFTCVAGNQSYALSYYLGVTCFPWEMLDVSELRELVIGANNSYFILNKDGITSGFGRVDQHIELPYQKEEFYLGCKRSTIECDMLYEDLKDYKDKYDWFISGILYVLESEILPNDSSSNFDFNIYTNKK